MMVIGLLLVLNFSIGVSASSGYDRQEVDACITISQRLSVKGESGTRPTWRQSEIDAKADFPDYKEQISFMDGKEVPYGTKGSVRPDYYKAGNSVDIKNYNVETATGRSNLVNNSIMEKTNNGITVYFKTN